MRYLSPSNGVLRGVAFPNIYDKTITVVSNFPSPPSTILATTAGNAITLPSSGSYTVSSSVPNLNLFLNGQKLEYSIDWNTSGAGPNYTAFTLTQNIVAGDVIVARIERDS